MNDYEKAFVVKMSRLKRAGIDLEALTREALTGKFGGATDIMLRGMSQEAMDDPQVFVKELSRTFGRGAIGVYEPIVKFVDMGLYSTSSSSPVLGLLSQLGPETRDSPSQEGVILHNHRVKDEEGNYSDNSV